MALFTQQTILAKQAVDIPFKKQTKLINTVLVTSALFGMLSLSACQTAPTSINKTPAVTTTSVTQAPIIETEIETENNYPIEPDTPSEQTTSTKPITAATPVFTPPSQSPVVTQPDIVILTPSREDEIISQPSIPSHNDLLERARQNSQQRSQQTATNNSNLPAFRNLMQVGTGQLKAGNLNGAESSFTRAQRLAPKSSAVYFYLAQVALKKNQPRKAEAMARRGLSVSQDSSRRRALWQIILQSGQQQGNARVIKEAKQALR
ncbi:M48 family metallopeptidase [Psychrobacter sp. DAB_AL32B]|uniref:tetratricopeptide repeat protein n=1 Tax=Psychrobacter sp. DAB_AL32B TaxID=1028414 RepID=UPI000B7DF251|nr:tetratricopeptide repeat protein [Psychrobacter sp. DAB_AL32B]OXL28488.1 hypothetical protein CAN34_00875 [Psychrobacter sp. DAB_AL32B]